jgi:hypothetical protein
MKKMILRKKNQPNQEPLAEKSVPNLTLRKLTLKTGVRAGVEAGGGPGTQVSSCTNSAGF